MDDLTIRSIDPDELATFMQTLLFAFHDSELEEGIERERVILEPDRYFVALDGEVMVATAGACSTRLTVPGGRSLPAAGVTAVGVIPSHRRRGITTRMMATLLDQAAERGEPLVYLWASESPIYGRFGYGTASFCTELEMTTHRSAFIPDVRIEGRIRALLREQALPLIRPMYEAVAASRPGMIEVDDRWWRWLFLERRKDKEEPRFYAVHEDPAGVVDGFAVYTVKHEWPHGIASNELSVQQLVAATPAASAGLWRYLLDVDLVATVKAWDRPADEELLRFVREPRRLKLTTSDGLWLRLIDIPAALAGRRFGADGRLIIEVEDAFRPATSGRYELVVDGGEGTCRRTDADADLSCGVAALGAAYLGGSSFHQLAWAHQMREVTPDALMRADAMFASAPSPWFGFIF